MKCNNNSLVNRGIKNPVELSDIIIIIPITHLLQNNAGRITLEDFRESQLLLFPYFDRDISLLT